LIKSIMGMVQPSSGSIVVEIDGVKCDLKGMPPEAIVDLGIAIVPEGRQLFPKLSVEENCCSAPIGARRGRRSPKYGILLRNVPATEGAE